jgi:hypothetical protein
MERMKQDTLQPRENRSRVIIRAIVHGPCGMEPERRVRDLSATGACVEQSGNLIAGDRVSLDIGPMKDIAGRVVWTTEYLAGIAFAEPIEVARTQKHRSEVVTAASGWVSGFVDPWR